MVAGLYEFKAASEDWKTINLGAVSGSAGDREVTLGRQQPVIQAAAENLIYTAAVERAVVSVLDSMNPLRL